MLINLMCDTIPKRPRSIRKVEKPYLVFVRSLIVHDRITHSSDQAPAKMSILSGPMMRTSVPVHQQQ